MAHIGPNHPKATPSSQELPEADKSALHNGSKVAPFNAHPQLAGRRLGQHFGITGVKSFLRAMKANPVDTLRLMTGRLSNMRKTNPSKYMETLSHFCTKSEHWKALAQEGLSMRANVKSPSSDIDPFVRKAVGHVASDMANTLDTDKFLHSFRDLGKMCAHLSSTTQKFPSDTQPGAGIATAMAKAGDICHELKPSELKVLTKTIVSVDKAVPTPAAKAAAKTVMDRADSLMETTKARRAKLLAQQAMQPLDDVKATLMAAPEDREAWWQLNMLASVYDSEAVKEVIDDVHIKNMNKPMAELWWVKSELDDDPTDPKLWQAYDKIEPKLSHYDKATFMALLKAKHGETKEIQQRLSRANKPNQ
ncbi:hypothetical protein [Parendozoicomonas sp. Alg238-R29]|uniref:hypothetical protein n=1 Tax=Parendozoicomonas sp. Alg238-R29 TaxID=2993446 RepID=UPI00248E9200|nr:hypothetical protein [Parendozoicomonas sp. Alg238-R29]